MEAQWQKRHTQKAKGGTKDDHVNTEDDSLTEVCISICEVEQYDRFWTNAQFEGWIASNEVDARKGARLDRGNRLLTC